MVDLLSRPQAEGLATLVLIDEVLMFARGKVAMDEAWRGRLIDFFQYLCQAVTKVDRCALVASLLASDLDKSDDTGKAISAQISEIFNRQKEEGVQPVQKEDVARCFAAVSSRQLRSRIRTPFSRTSRLPCGTWPQSTIPSARTARTPRNASPADIPSTRISPTSSTPGGHSSIGSSGPAAFSGRSRSRCAMPSAGNQSPLVGPNVFLPAPDRAGIAEAARELTGIATREITESRGHDWAAILEGELAKARKIQENEPGLKHREIEQAVCTVFLSSQPVGQKAHTRDLIGLVGPTQPDRIELEQGLRRWTDLSWFLDENEFGTELAPDGGPSPLPKAWRLGNRPNLKQMHDDACANRVTSDAVDIRLLAEVRATKSLTHGTRAFGVRVHMLPERPRDVEDDGEFHFAILPPPAVSNASRPSRTARRFIDETTGPDRPRIRRNAVVLVTPSTDGLEVVRTRVREYLGWEDVQNQLRGQPQDPVREDMLATWTEAARRRIPEAVRQAWTIVVTVNPENEIHAFRATVASEPLFATIKADRRARIQETAINAEAMLPGGPYDLWRQDEASRRVKDLAMAFAENPRLPKMLRSQEILSTIDRGVQDGFFVASLLRPDRTVKTWWRTPIPEAVRTEPALELFLLGGATLSDLDQGVLAQGVLPELWTDDSVTVAAVVDYFSGGRTVMVQREGYEEPVDIPACPPGAVETAIAEAVQQGGLWLLNGPASFQSEPLPAGVLTPAATLRAPMEPIPVDRLMPDALPDGWKASETTVLAVSLALAGQEGHPSRGRSCAAPWTTRSRHVGGDHAGER